MVLESSHISVRSFVCLSQPGVNIAGGSLEQWVTSRPRRQLKSELTPSLRFLINTHWVAPLPPCCFTSVQPNISFFCTLFGPAALDLFRQTGPRRIIQFSERDGRHPGCLPRTQQQCKQEVRKIGNPFVCSAFTLSSLVLFSPSMAAVCRGPRATPAGTVTPEATASRGHRASPAATVSKARRASASTRSSRSPGGPTTSSAPGTLSTTGSTWAKWPWVFARKLRATPVQIRWLLTGRRLCLPALTRTARSPSCVRTAPSGSSSAAPSGSSARTPAASAGTSPSTEPSAQDRCPSSPSST